LSFNYFNREKRFLKNINILFLLLPLILLPLLVEWWFHSKNIQIFLDYRHEILFSNIAYIVLIRFALLDTAVYIFSHSQHTVHIALIQVVLLYLEITVITILYYAIVFDIFDVFSLFHLSAKLTEENLADIHKHSLITSMYISTVTFTTLGSGDWIPQTLSAMIAVISEVILGVVQGGVFVAIVIYAHQNKKIIN
jgi:hypothetical protein